jgi:hypothetical protein
LQTAVFSALRIGVAPLIERLLGMLVALCRSLALLLAGFRTAALLLTGIWGRRLVLLARLVLVRHGISFLGNAKITACASASFLTRKMRVHDAAPLSALPPASAVGSRITIRTHKHQPTNKREPVFRRNH